LAAPVLTELSSSDIGTETR